MSQQNVDIVQGMYKAFATGDIPTVLAALDPQVEWWEAENFIYDDGNPYVGPEAVLQGVFMRIVTEWDGLLLQRKCLTLETRLLVTDITAAPIRRTVNMQRLSLRTSLLSVTGRSCGFSNTPTRLNSNR